MAKENDGKSGGCIFQWKIENISHCWWLGKDLEIGSPAFVVDSLRHTKWSLMLCPNSKDEKIGIFLNREEDCEGPDNIAVYCRFMLLSKTGSILKTGNLMANEFSKDCHWGFANFIENKRVLITERDLFLYEDTLNVQCQIWMGDEEPSNSNRLFGTSAIKVKRRYFQWKIKEFHTLESGLINNFKDYLIGFDVALNKKLDQLDIDITSIDGNVNYISCNISVSDWDGSKKNCGTQTYFYTDISESLSFTITLPVEVMVDQFLNDVLSFEFELVFAVLERFMEHQKRFGVLENKIVEKEEPENGNSLNDDLKSLYNDGIFCDMVLRTSSKDFPVHKIILGARSPVFKRMFTNDMKDINSGHVDIDDFEDETIQQMLLFLYTDSFEDLKFESAYKLYQIAVRYEILSLKSKCTSFLMENLRPENACKVLDLAIRYLDHDLFSSVREFIFGERKHIFHTEEWKDFMSTRLDIAADIMLRKLTKKYVSHNGVYYLF